MREDREHAEEHFEGKREEDEFVDMALKLHTTPQHHVRTDIVKRDAPPNEKQKGAHAMALTRNALLTDFDFVLDEAPMLYVSRTEDYAMALIVISVLGSTAKVKDGKGSSNTRAVAMTQLKHSGSDEQ